MSGAASGAGPPPLRFENAVVDGPLPRREGDTAVRLLSQTLSPAAAAEHASATAAWRVQLRTEPKTPALRLLSELPRDAAADEDAVLVSARRFLGLGSGKACSPRTRAAARARMAALRARLIRRLTLQTFRGTCQCRRLVPTARCLRTPPRTPRSRRST